MKKLKTQFGLAAVLLGLCFLSGSAFSQDQEKEKPMGPPDWVLEAWESGEAPVVPKFGPPAWVIEAWKNGERPKRPIGPPPHVAKRQQLAIDLGLPGPPEEVLEAWKNGEGFELPGPPESILDRLEN